MLRKTFLRSPELIDQVAQLPCGRVAHLINAVIGKVLVRQMSGYATYQASGITSGLPVILPEPAEFCGACGGSSFVPQRHHGIDMHGPQRGNKAGDKCHRGNNEHNDHEGEWIVGADSKQKAADETARKD